VSPSFAPALGRVVAASAQRPLSALWDDPAELARFALDLARRTGATHVLFPFDALVVAEAAGADLRWDNDEPAITGTDGVELVDAEPVELAERARWRRSLEAAGYIAGLHPVAGLVPSPGRLVEQTGGPAGDENWLESAADVCAAFARGLLEAGARALVVEPADGEPEATTSGLVRVAELFGAECHRSGVVRLPLATAPMMVPAHALGARIVLGDRPLEPGMDLGAVLALSQSLAGSTHTC
jgi:hypothetical protein